ncbi:MAG: hypothetical protein JWP44_4995 [Mucilaginibacter sp.]|jgi:hypothetical protein|nr:hypothetical protein [Mucilaginibacter sp.]
MLRRMVFPKAEGHAVIICYGAVAAEGGQCWWGREQLANTRRSLKKFDGLWQEALQSPE